MSNFFQRKRTQQPATPEDGKDAATGSVKGGARRRGPQPITDENALYEYAVAALLRQMRTAAELKRALRKRLEPGAEGLAMLERVIERLKARQYLSDARYAASYSTQRKDGRRLGARRVAQDLRQKGVHPDVVNTAVEAAYQDTDEETQARAFLVRKRVLRPETGDERAKARVCRQLARAGFSPRIAFHILRNWDAPISS
jgi:regulatory protein